MRRVLPFFCALLAACDDNYGTGPAIGALLTGDAVGMAGQVWQLAPGADAVVSVSPTTRETKYHTVGRGPTQLQRAPGRDRLYTLNAEANTITRLTPDGDTASVEIRAPFNRFDWAPDGEKAILWLDPNAGIDVSAEGSVNRNAYAVLRDDGTELSITAGTFDYTPLEVHWDDAGRRALVRTEGRLSVFDLGVSPVEERSVPFSADEASPRTPNGVAISPDGGRALVSTINSSDLFVLDLDPVLIENVVGLVGLPSALAFSADGTRAVIANGTTTLQFVDLESFETESLTLNHTASRFRESRVAAEPFVLAWYPNNTTSRFSKLPLTGPDLAPDEHETFTLDSPIAEILLSPEEEAAVVLHDGSAFGSEEYGAELSLFHLERRAPSQILLDAPATDLLFLEGATVGDGEDESAFLCIRNTRRLVRYNLRTYDQVVLRTYELPVQVGVVPAFGDASTTLFVRHDNDAGLLSFVSPGAEEEPPGGFPGVFGFGLDSILDRRSR